MIDAKINPDVIQTPDEHDASYHNSSGKTRITHGNPITRKGVIAVTITALGVIGAVVGTEIATPLLVLLSLSAAVAGAAIKVADTFAQRP